MSPPPNFKALKGRQNKAQGQEQRDAALGSQPQKTPSPEGAAETPDGWTTAKLGDLGSWRGGGTPSKSKKEFWTNGTIPWVSPKDMKKPRLSSAEDSITEAAVAGSATSKLNAGSVLLVTRSGILSHSLPVAINLVPVALNQDLKAIAPCGAVDSEFLWLTFRCFEREILNTCRKAGTTVASLEFPQLLDFTIPLPPLAEQKRIVAKIEELFSELDAGEESLRRARRQLGVYRQSLLKQAFEGKLTAPLPGRQAGWRDPDFRNISDKRVPVESSSYFAYVLICKGGHLYKGFTQNLFTRIDRHLAGTGATFTKKHKPEALLHFEEFKTEPEAVQREKYFKSGCGREWLYELRARQEGKHPTAGQLLARIQAERQARYQQQLKEWEKAGGGRGKPKKPKPIAPPADLKLASPRDLPTGWVWIAVADVGRIETGTTPATKQPKNYGGDTPFFKPTDLDQSANVRDAREYLSAMGREAARILPAGTTLVTCIGATIGKTGLASVECATNQQINSISPEACFDPRFVFYAAVAPSLNGLIKSEASATTLPILNKSKFESLPFPVASLPEQQEIVRLLDEQFEVIEQNEREIDAALKRSEALRQSILRRAFTGQLVPPDPTAEPASTLLARIPAEREEAEQTKPATKRTPAKKSQTTTKNARKVPRKARSTEKP